MDFRAMPTPPKVMKLRKLVQSWLRGPGSIDIRGVPIVIESRLAVTCVLCVFFVVLGTLTQSCIATDKPT